MKKWPRGRRRLDADSKNVRQEKREHKMSVEEKIKEQLEDIRVPGVMRSLDKMNLIREIRVSQGTALVELASAGLHPGAQRWIREKARDAVEKLEEVRKATIEFTEVVPKDLNRVTHHIAVMSGKGGVGKSLVASLTAVALKREGFDVGILDADLTGPSIPKMFGIKDRPMGSETGILPVLSHTGIEIMSINLLLPSAEDAVIWRGPLIGKTITQFGEEVLWGKLDYLIIDLPPGTSDAPLTVLQSFPITGVVIVFTPQDLVELIVKKAVNMARKMEKHVIGVVENMSYLYIQEIDKKIEVFGKSRGEEMAQAVGAPLLGKLPIDPELTKLCDRGDIELYHGEFIDRLGSSLSQLVKACIG
jgi:Mrp family chromosome partitioning ATPase